jgi:hypothetical protein
MIGVSRTTVWRTVQAGRFPRPVCITERNRGYLLEFNAMTKYFYTDRSTPKKRLGQAEMAEVNRLYRIIGAREQDLARLHAGPASSASTAGSDVQHKATAVYVAVGALLVILAIAAYRLRDSRRR